MAGSFLAVLLIGAFSFQLISADSDPSPDWYYKPYCSETPVYHGWAPTSRLEGEWSLVRYSSTGNTLPIPNCGRVTITGSSNETKTWSTSIEDSNGEIVTVTKETKVTSLEISSGRWVLNDFGVFAQVEYSMKPLSSLLLLGYTKPATATEYDTILFASCTYIQVPMGQPLNRISEFGILTRRGEEDLYSDPYFRMRYNRVLEMAGLGSTDDMISYSHAECSSK